MPPVKIRRLFLLGGDLGEDAVQIFVEETRESEVDQLVVKEGEEEDI